MAVTEQRLATMVLVIGTGGAGLRAAIELAEAGIDVLAVGKRPKEDAHTALAAGGINAALATMDPEDSWQQHAADTLKESYLLADPRTVEIVTQGAARGIDDLERYGMTFAREGDGRISQRFFGAHKFRRTAFAGDYTGLEIQRTLVRRAEQLDIPVLEGVYITRLLVHEGAVFGAYGFDLTSGRRYLIHADAVVLAAGGHTRIWRRTSSRRDENTGDSFRLAVEAGARLRDAELVQFHPSGIIEPENAAGTLVSEAARGEGGILRNALGERFMARYDPERMELSTRDRVALAAYTEIKEGRGTPKGGVWLDVSHLPRQTIMTRLPASTTPCWTCRCWTSPANRSRSRPPRTTRWAVCGCARRITAPTYVACTPSARHRAGCTAPTASAVTASSNCWCSAASPARRPPRIRSP